MANTCLNKTIGQTSNGRTTRNTTLWLIFYAYFRLFLICPPNELWFVAGAKRKVSEALANCNFDHYVSGRGAPPNPAGNHVYDLNVVNTKMDILCCAEMVIRRRQCRHYPLLSRFNARTQTHSQLCKYSILKWEETLNCMSRMKWILSYEMKKMKW